MKRFKDSSSELDEDDDIDVDSPGGKTQEKKHRKHKHKKHKRSKVDSTSKKSKDEASSSTSKSTAANNLKLKIKFTEENEKESASPKTKRKLDVSESPVQKYVDKISQGLGLPPPGTSSQTPPSKPSSGKKKKTQRKDSETSSEEERWLDAIQSGKLHEVDEELKKIKPKDPKLMTARQRAMLERKADKEPEEQLMSLPSGYKEVVMTAEAVQRNLIKSQKRKQKADEKREKDKKKTMERLLKKQDSKTIKSGAKKVQKKTTPQMTYHIAVNGPSIDVPQGFNFPLTATKAKPPPPVILCAIKGCKNPKRYSCSRSGVPICSLKCYQSNIANIMGEVILRGQ